MSSEALVNPNIACYEALAPCYEAIYGQIDARETVRQWHQLLIKAELLVKPKRTLRLLDIGCGPGWHTKAWQELGFEVAGLDSSPTLLASARERLVGEGKRADLYLADILDSASLSELPHFDLAVSHFNFLNLFNQKQREEVFQSVAHLIRPGGYWVTDFTEPCSPPAPVEETIHLPTGVLKRKGKFNNQLGCYDQQWEGPSLNCLERFWFDHSATAQSLTLRTGWRLYLRKAWHPYAPDAAWREPGEQDQVLVDVYLREGGGYEVDD